MTLMTWPWDDIGYPGEMDVTDICHTIEHTYSGYSASRPGSTKMQKAFSMVWPIMNTDQWLALIEFWRSVYGSANAFYWEFPVTLYGSPGYGGYGGLEPPDGFDADIDVGYGSGPIFTVKFVGNELPQRYRGNSPGYWKVEATVREVA